jgi:hypothetical protein
MIRMTGIILFSLIATAADGELKEIGYGGALRLRSLGQAGFTPDMSQRIRAVLDASIPQFKAASR